jgi:hypothetical protein
MNNTYLTFEEIKKAFHEANLVENYNFLEEDLQALANAFVMKAVPSITAEEREKCVTFVRSLNTQVAQALADFKGEV